MQRSNTISLIGLGAMLLLASPSDAWAYIDPGTGSYLFQLVVAGGLAAAYTVRMYWNTLRDRLLGRRDRQPDQSAK